MNLSPVRLVPPITYGLTASGDPDTSEIPEMRVKWVPVLRDPSEPASKDNPMIGRYAFWMDDEYAKINFNLAHGKPASGEPMRISTSSITGGCNHRSSPKVTSRPKWDRHGERGLSGSRSR